MVRFIVIRPYDKIKTCCVLETESIKQQRIKHNSLGKLTVHAQMKVLRWDLLGQIRRPHQNQRTQSQSPRKDHVH